jgi:hypothetical protein
MASILRIQQKLPDESALITQQPLHGEGTSNLNPQKYARMKHEHQLPDLRTDFVLLSGS